MNTPRYELVRSPLRLAPLYKLEPLLPTLLDENWKHKNGSQLRLKRALHHAVQPASDRAYQPGDRVLVWREKQVNNRIGEWLGPLTVVSYQLEKKLVFVKDTENGPPRPFNLTMVKQYLEPEQLSRSFMSNISRSFSYFKSPTENDCFLTEIIDPRDPRARSMKMVAAKKDEVRNLLKRGTFKGMLKEDIPPDGNVLPGRFVLSIKSTEDQEIKFKARYVIGDHRDKLKDLMVHTSTTLQTASVRLLLPLAAIFGLDVWTSDVRQAYLQAAVPLVRDIYRKNPAAEFELSSEQFLQLLKPLYGQCESEDIWHDTFNRHHREDLGMVPFKFDPALYHFMCNRILRGLSAGYVDDLIRAGDKQFRELSRKTNKIFETGEDEQLPCNFPGFALKRDDKGNLILDQHAYLRLARSLKTRLPV